MSHMQHGSGTASLRSLVRAFAPAPSAPVVLRDPAQIAAEYRRWQTRVLVFSILGYAAFYLVRKNLGFAMPVMGKELGIGKSQLGLFLTLHGLLYGVSKFANGFLADRANARVVMVTALLASALLNAFFGLSSSVLAFGLIWMVNGWFQGMGYPPCARLLTHWFSPRVLATKWSIWNTSHSIGAGLIAVLCGYLVLLNWRLCFFVPVLLALVCAVFLWRNLPDTPPSVGLPEVEGTQSRRGDEGSPADFQAFLFAQVFRNKYIWLFALASFCV
jgi:sugar phosphate permease